MGQSFESFFSSRWGEPCFQERSTSPKHRTHFIMKKLLFFCLITLLFVLTGCYKENSFITQDALSHERNQREKSSYVSINDAWRYIENNHPAETKGGEVVSILPIIDKVQDTLLYIVNYTDGWSILSSDRRVPAVVASSPTGKLSLDNDNRAFLSWLNSTAIDIKRIRESEDSELRFSKEQIDAHRSIWDQSSVNRVIPNEPITPGDSIKINGSWVLEETHSYYETLEDKSHSMVQEHWSQGYPYNVYCPQDSNGNNYEVGCAGVAAGALLHYLYRKYGFPTSFSGIPMDSVAVNYSSVLTDSTNVTARYLRAVNDDMGLNVYINYWQGGTFALPNQVSSMFSNHGYSCSYDSFDSDIVKTILMSQKPVLVVAFDEWILNLADVTEGHYFILDGYELKRPVTAYHYVYVENGVVRPQYGERVEYTYGSPFIVNVTMNWGWSTQWTSNIDNGWYSLTGSWTTNYGTYDIFRHMFYNFH